MGVTGSGKSNFFKGIEVLIRSIVAIQFVLSPKYMKIDEERMKELFHVLLIVLQSFPERTQ